MGGFWDTRDVLCPHLCEIPGVGNFFMKINWAGHCDFYVCVIQ